MRVRMLVREYSWPRALRRGRSGRDGQEGTKEGTDEEETDAGRFFRRGAHLRAWTACRRAPTACFCGTRLGKFHNWRENFC